MMVAGNPAREVPEVTADGHFERVAVVYESLRVLSVPVAVRVAGAVLCGCGRDGISSCQIRASRISASPSPATTGWRKK